MWTILKWIGITVLVLALIGGIFVVGRITTPTTIAQTVATATPEVYTKDAPIAPTQQIFEQASPANTEEVNVNEPIKGTLDDFGVATRYDDRFTLKGEIWDQSYNEDEIFVANGFAFHDNGFVSQNGCVVMYYKAPSGGGRIRFTGWDGMGFELDADSGISLNQAIAAMHETLVRAHGCNPENIQYHEVVHYGDPIK